jgi:hypothetical protein
MRIALLADYEKSATWWILKDIEKVLKDYEDTEVQVFARGEDPPNWEDFDIAHYGWAGLIGVFPECPLPKTTTIWQIPGEKFLSWQAQLGQFGFDHYIVDDVGTLQTLGQMGYTQVTKIPLTFDYSRFKPLPLPKEFTVGVFGNNYASKNFGVVRAACEKGGFTFFPQILPKTRRHYILDPSEDYYQHISVHVHASFGDTNSMPGMEALLCGRSVISTRNYGLERLSSVPNLHTFNGSVADLVRVLKSTQFQPWKMEWCSEYERWFPRHESSVTMFYEILCAVLERQ